MREISKYTNKIRVWITADEAELVNDYIARTGVNFSYLMNKAIKEFVDTEQPVKKRTDARLIVDSDKPRKNFARTAQLTELTEAILSIEVENKKVSRSSYGAQAILYFVNNN